MRFKTLLAPGRRRRATTVAAAAGLASIANAGVAAPARAGEYIDWVCHTPSGQPTTTDGWSITNSATDMSTVHAFASCAADAHGSLTAVFGGSAGTSYASGTWVGWSFVPPAGITIAHANLRRSVEIPVNSTTSAADTGSGTAGVAWFKNGLGDDTAHLVDSCRRSTGCNGDAVSERLSFDPDGSRNGVAFVAGCFGPSSGTCKGVAGVERATVSVGWGELRLQDNANPVVSSVGGSALSGRMLHGLESLAFDATDVGSGVWQAAVTLDGVAVAPRSTVDANGGKCVTTPYYGSAYAGAEFGSAAPCKLAVSAAIPIDTTKVANGSHLLQATVWDASGNSDVAATQQVTVDNASAPAPVPAVANGRTGDLATGHFTSKAKPRTVEIAYGKGSKLSGTLHDKRGTAIAGAVVDILAGPIVPGVVGAKIGAVTTDAKGRFSYRPPSDADCTVVFAYAPQTPSVAYVDRCEIRVHVTAAVTLHADRATVTRGRPVRFSGTVAAGTLPRSGARVEIDALQGGRWVLAANRVTSADGRFTWTHRFTHAQRFGFRARVLKTDGLVVHPGTSRTIAVRVR